MFIYKNKCYLFICIFNSYFGVLGKYDLIRISRMKLYILYKTNCVYAQVQDKQQDTVGAFMLPVFLKNLQKIHLKLKMPTVL